MRVELALRCDGVGRNASPVRIDGRCGLIPSPLRELGGIEPISLFAMAGGESEWGHSRDDYPLCAAAAMARSSERVGRRPSAITRSALKRSAAVTYPERSGTATGAPAAGSRMYM
jgi:hypothetical protein